MRLGRGGNVVGRGGGGCRIHDSISSMQLGRSGDARTARKTPKTPKKQMVMERRMDIGHSGVESRVHATKNGITSAIIEQSS